MYMNDFNPMTMKESFFWSFILLIISVWSAFSFYWSGYRNGELSTKNQILSQQREIHNLKKQLLETQVTLYSKQPVFSIATSDKQF